MWTLILSNIITINILITEFTFRPESSLGTNKLVNSVNTSDRKAALSSISVEVALNNQKNLINKKFASIYFTFFDRTLLEIRGHLRLISSKNCWITCSFPLWLDFSSLKISLLIPISEVSEKLDPWLGPRSWESELNDQDFCTLPVLENSGLLIIF